MTVAVEVSGLSVALIRGAAIVENIAFRLAEGEVLGFVGESGSGKSTIAMALMGFARPGTHIASGSVVIDGRDILSLSDGQRRHCRGHVVTYVPQDPSVSLNPSMRIDDQLVEGLVNGGERLSRPAAIERVKEVMAAVALPATDEFLSRYPVQLSGGQQQRVGIAMAVAPRPRLMILDEPTTGLDVVTQGEVLDLVGRLCRDMRMAAIYVSHDLDVVAHVASRVMVLYSGRIVELGDRDRTLSRPAHPYTVSLLDALPSVDRRRRLSAIAGHAPAVGARPAGCVFAPRCPHATADCRREEPALGPVEDGRLVCCLYPGISSPRRAPDAAASGGHGAGNEPPRLAVNGLSLSYGSRQVLIDVSLRLAPGECLALVGESGSGKSSLSHCIAGLNSLYGGDIVLDGGVLPKAAEKRRPAERRKLQYIFQNPYGSLNPRRTVADSIRMACTIFREERGKAADALTLETMARAGLSPALANRYPGELSGGERQRVAIARALIAAPTVLVCDEITSALDVSVQAAIVEMLRGLMDDGLSILFVTHNLAVVRSLADTVAVLRAGHIVESDPTETVLDAPRSDYARSLIAATRRIAGFDPNARERA
ncbi:MAG: ABC transporter ATP-binding protein [Rhizobiaceae bacterium]|nr:ABC transporter ATP-binding protein [Rhizobiaceae bacterium]